MRKIFTLLAVLSCIGLNGAEKSKIEKTKGAVAPSEKLTLGENYVRADTDLRVTVQAKRFQPFAFGRGNETLYRSNWFEITENEVIFFDVVLVNKIIEEDTGIAGSTIKSKARMREKKEVRRYEHGLNLKKAMSVTARLDVAKESATLYIEAGKEKFETPVKGWFGGGEPFVANLGMAQINAVISFERKTADQPVWFLGASYFNSFNGGRWPYYMRQEGYDNWMADHLPGGNSTRFIKCFEEDLKYGTPKICFWTLQANDKADTDVIDPTWLKNTEKFISLCKENGIEPILCIYPFMPGRNHSKKAEWVRKSGYRYMDLYSAVCYEDGTWKDTNWVSKDLVHPTKEGSKAMWEGIKKQFPDIFR